LTGYSDEEAAALYSVLNPSGPGEAFYLPLILDASSVLDVGCGTGTLLHEARDAGHTGRLCGIDPDEARLDVARRRTDIDWVCCAAASIPFAAEFDLAVMTGHAFQELVSDQDIRQSLAGIRRALVDGGRFAFETRNPLAQAWTAWTPRNAMDAVDASGREVRIWHEVEAVTGDVVTLTETTGDRDGTPLRVDRASLRFLGMNAIGGFLAEGGFLIEAQYGDWLGQPLDTTSPEIITLALKDS
jgi:SAM-dependent methyltransferase